MDTEMLVTFVIMALIVIGAIIGVIARCVAAGIGIGEMINYFIKK